LLPANQARPAAELLSRLSSSANVARDCLISSAKLRLSAIASAV
jgi:hypothetical protein